MTSDDKRQAAAASRVDVALANIQEAQELVEQASRALSAIAGMALGARGSAASRLS